MRTSWNCANNAGSSSTSRAVHVWPSRESSCSVLATSNRGQSLAAVGTLADHPELEAAIDCLKQHPLFARKFYYCNGHENDRLALVGHSRGGWAAANVGYRRGDVH